MSWFDRIFKRGSRSNGDTSASVPGPLQPEQWTVPGVTFDTAGWALVEASASRMSWKAPAGTLTLTREAIQDATPHASLTDLRNHARLQARSREEDLVQLDVASVRGVEVLHAIYKSRRSSGSAYRLLVEIRGLDTRIRVESDIDEGNFTGTREAMVNAMRVQAGETVIGPPNPDGSRAIQGFFLDAYDPAFDDGALNSITDDDRLDVLLPMHPLSRTRALLETITGSLRVDPDISPARILATSPRGDESRPPRRALSFVVLRSLYGAAGRFDLVEAVLHQEIAHLGDTPSLDLANALMQLGIFLHMRDRPGNALPLLSRAERMFLELTGTDGPGTATARAHHGCALMKLGRRAQSLPLFEQAIPVLEKKRRDDGTYILALANAAQLLAERGDERTAADYLRRAQALMGRMNAE